MGWVQWGLKAGGTASASSWAPQLAVHLPGLRQIGLGVMWARALGRGASGRSPLTWEGAAATATGAAFAIASAGNGVTNRH